ncbi:MAG: exodeoxyribonuclease V alpha subunit, partial [Rhodothermales bacterium]
MPLIEELKDVRATGAISPTAWQFGRFVCRHADANDDGQLFLAAILASQAVEASHVCADIAHLHADLNGHYPRYDDSRIRAAFAADTRLPTAVLPAPDTWLAHLRNDPRCQRVICTPATYATAPKPLVIDEHGRVYLHRYFDFEIQLADVLRTMATTRPTITVESTAATTAALDTLFPSVDRPGWDVNWPKVAGFAALNRRLTVITGGPGTGKTTVVARLLALVQQLYDKDLRISLAAPTGKAAARLAEALEEQREELENAGIEAGAVDVKASTIHRLLGYRPNSIHFRHNAANPIDADLVIIDEASMVPLPMMRRIVDAVPEGARLILLGDMYQLASVESGYVLGDLCNAAHPAVFSADFRSRFEAVTTGPKDVIPAATDEP